MLDLYDDSCEPQFFTYDFSAENFGGISAIRFGGNVGGILAVKFGRYIAEPTVQCLVVLG